MPQKWLNNFVEPVSRKHTKRTITTSPRYLILSMSDFKMTI